MGGKLKVEKEALRSLGTQVTRLTPTWCQGWPMSGRALNINGNVWYFNFGAKSAALRMPHRPNVAQNVAQAVWLLKIYIHWCE